MKCLILILALAFTSASFSANELIEVKICTQDVVFIPCTLTIIGSEYDPITRTYIPTSTTYYLGDVDYGAPGFNVAACVQRARTFVAALYDAP